MTDFERLDYRRATRLIDDAHALVMAALNLPIDPRTLELLLEADTRLKRAYDRAEAYGS